MLAGPDDIGRKIVGERSAVAVNLNPVRWSAGVDPAEFEHALGAALKGAEHIEQIGNDHYVTAPLRVQDLAARKNASDVAEPSLQHLHINTEREHVEPADLDLLPPMRRSSGIKISARKALQPHVMRPADVVFGQQFFHKQIGPHSIW